MSENVKITFTVENGQAVANIEKVNTALGNTDKKSTANVASLGMMAAKFAVVAGAVIGAGAAIGKFVSNAAEAERVQMKLKNALQISGQYTEKMMKQTAALSSEIQRTTTIDDEMAGTLQALAINMGATGDKITEVVKGAIGFNKAFGIDMETGIKVVSQAMNGNFNALQRYVPALQGAKTEAEKMAIVQKAMAGGFKLAQDEAKTFNGAMAQLKNATDDAQEILGTSLIPVLTKAAKELTNFISSKEGMRDLENISKGIAITFIVIKDVFKIVYETIKFQIEGLVKIFKTLFTVIDKASKKDFKGALETMTDAMKDSVKDHKNYGKKLIDIYKDSSKEIEDVVRGSNAVIVADNAAADTIIAENKRISFDQIKSFSDLFFGNLSSLMQTKNKEMFNIGKAASIAQATINTYQAATSAYAAMAPVPFIGPFLGAAAAAAAVVAGLVNINNIKNTKFQAAEDGGIIPASAEGTLIKAGEKNKQEMIIPFENEKAMSKLKGLGSTTINVYVENLMADDTMPAKVAKKIDEALYNLKRKGQSVFA